MIEQVKAYCFENLPSQHFDSLAFGVVDFKSKKFESFELTKTESISKKSYFDLASLTKVLTLASTYLIDSKIFTEDMKLLLNHSGGLPAWGLLSKDDFKKQLSSFKIKKSETLYSDFSALRLMLEIEKVSKKKLKSICSKNWDKDLMSWLDLKEGMTSPVTGTRNSHVVSGEVHDPNAFNLKEFCSHAGLFGTIESVCKTLLNMDKNESMLSVLSRDFDSFDHKDRFLNGWDTANPSNAETLAGVGCSPKTFGHLGFTGTSIWIDCEKSMGWVLLSNATQSFWYDKAGINKMRREIGAIVWQ